MRRRQGGKEKDSQNRKTCDSRSFWDNKLGKIFSCFHSKLILKKSQANGLRDPKCGCTFEPFVFTECRRALPGEIRANGLVPVPLPLQPWA